jgi:hypothetical protein
MKPIDDLIKAIDAHESAAREIIGCPGPGIDIIIRPTNPLSTRWLVEAKTEAGRRFIARFWPSGIDTSANLTRFKREAVDWGLTFHVNWESLA